MIVKAIQRWLGSDLQPFRVQEVKQIDGKTWVFYTNSKGTQFSCLEESFVRRFSHDLSWNSNRYE